VPSINGLEFVILAVLALVILGPDKLPRYAADAGRLLRSVRRMAADAKREVADSLGPELNDIDLADFNPRGFAKRHLLDDDDLGMDDDFGLDDDLGDERPRRSRSRSAPRGDGPGADVGERAHLADPARDNGRAPRPAPYDPDAT
jgi:sec-independent protein translocase protein TatB